jgi:hypothetical protein
MTDIRSLQREAESARQAGQAAARAYDRGAWIKLGIHFFAVPFVVLVFRHHLEPWSYCVLGALYMLVAGALLYLDRKERAARDVALQAAGQAQRDYERALRQAAGPGRPDLASHRPGFFTQ